MASFFIRIHELDLKTTGLILGIGGAIGVISPPLYGWLADKLGALDPRWPLRLVWLSGIFIFASGLIMLFTPSVVLAVVLFVLVDVTRGGYPPPSYAVLMANTPVRMRGTIMSVLQFTTNLVGFGLGPLFAGFLSDLYGGESGIRYALANVLMLFLVIVPLLITANYLLFGRRKPSVARPDRRVG